MANPSFPSMANTANENNLLKDWYTPERVRDLVYKKYPFTMMLRKNMDVSGRQLVVPQIYSDPQGTADTFKIAAGNSYPLTSATFNMLAHQKYTINSITARAMRQSRNEDGAFLDLMKENIDKSLKTHMNRIHIDLCANDGTGALAQFSSVAASVLPGYTNVVLVQLSIPEQARYFEVNARLTLGNTKNVALDPVTSSALGTLVRINRTSGQLYIALDLPLPAPSVPPLQWLGFDGDFITNLPSENADPWQGLPAWIPTVAVRTANAGAALLAPFNNVVRATDEDRLAGVALDLPGSPVRQAVIRLASAIDVNGGSPDVVYMHQFNFSQLVVELGSLVRYDNVVLAKEANIGYNSIVLQAETGELRIIQDSAIPKDTIYALEMDTWELACWGDFCNIVQDDGLTVLRGSGDNGDSVSWRARTFGALACNAVGFNGVVTI